MKTPTHIGTLSPIRIGHQLETDIVQSSGQNAIVLGTDSQGNTVGTLTPIPAQDVGGYMTLNSVDPTDNSNFVFDTSFAQKRVFGRHEPPCD